LARLDALMRTHCARRVVFLGDFLHSAHAQNPGTMAAVQAWRERHALTQLVLVRGNHDSRAGDPPPALDIDCVDEPFGLPSAPGLLLAHHPQAQAKGYVLAGHHHPCTTLGRGFERLRLPCFHFGAQVGVLPAFGAFTGMHPIERQAGDRVFVVADNGVHALA
jgi:DNA ligase-associated metallophosphoesterase